MECRERVYRILTSSLSVPLTRATFSFATLTLITIVSIFIGSLSASANDDNDGGTVERNGLSQKKMMENFLRANPDLDFLDPKYDKVDAQGNPIPVVLNGSEIPTAGPFWTVYPDTPKSEVNMKLPGEKYARMMKQQFALNPPRGQVASDAQTFAIMNQAMYMSARMTRDPNAVATKAQAEQAAQMTGAGNSMGEMAKDQAAGAIDYCSKYMVNFTVDGSNKWNRLRNEIFIPIGILLLLPGAVLSQVRATVAAGMPVVGETQSPFDGILRAIIAIFLIPATYLVVNYGIDVSNSITFTLADRYQQMFGTNMYSDAVCSEIRAFPTRKWSENLNARTAANTNWPQTQITDQQTLEKQLFESKIDDPCSGVNNAPADRADEAMPGSAVFARALSFGSNAALTAAWNVLCAFQMAYLIYLFLIGPVIAGLWVWPMKQLQDALPAWIEGCLTLCFWSLFWNTVILLIACFKGVGGETGTIMMSALNFLATAAVKHAFDFVGLIKEAGHHAANKAMSSGKGSKGGAQGKGAKNGKGLDGTGKGNAKGSAVGKDGVTGKTQSGGGMQTHEAGHDGVTGITGHEAGEGQPRGSEAGGGSMVNAASPDSAFPRVNPPVAPPPIDGALSNQGWATSHTLHTANGDYSVHSVHGAAGGESISLHRGDINGPKVGELNLTEQQLARINQGLAVDGASIVTADGMKFAVSGGNGTEFYSLLGKDGTASTLAFTNETARGNNRADGTLGSMSGVGELRRDADGSLSLIGTNGNQLPISVDQPFTLKDGTEVLVSGGGAQPFVEMTATSADGINVVSAAFANPPMPSDGSAARRTNELIASGSFAGVSVDSNGHLMLGNGSSAIELAIAGDGRLVAAGTEYSYSPNTGTFDVNGVSLPATALGGTLLTDAANGIASAESTVALLSQPSIAPFVGAAESDSLARTQLQLALNESGAGVSVAELINAAHGNYTAQAEVMAACAVSNGDVGAVAMRLGVSEATVSLAADNPLMAASLVSAEANLSAPYREEVAARIGMSESLVQAGANDPLIAAQMVGMEARTDSGFAAYTAPQMHLGSAQLVQEMGSNPVLAVQALGMSARHDPSFAAQAAAQLGTTSEYLVAAGNLPTIAADIAAHRGQEPVYQSYMESTTGMNQVDLKHASESLVAATQFAAKEATGDYATMVASAFAVNSGDLQAIADSPTAAARALSFETSHYSDYQQRIAETLDVSVSTLRGATDSHIDAARIVASDRVHCMEASGTLTARTGLHGDNNDSLLSPADRPHCAGDVTAWSQAAHSRVYAAENLAAESFNYAHGVDQMSAFYQVQPEVVRRAGEGDAVAAAQIVAAEASSNPRIMQELSATTGMPEVAIRSAAGDREIASQLAFAEIQHSSARKADAGTSPGGFMHTLKAALPAQPLNTIASQNDSLNETSIPGLAYVTRNGGRARNKKQEQEELEQAKLELDRITAQTSSV